MPEVRCGCEITAKTKRFWKVQLDMLELFMQICDKYHFRWQVNGGTLLGAVRHHGYIPWDDDIDIIMPRKDYDEFNRVAAKELPSHIALENPWVNPAEFGNQSRLRNSNTTQIDEWHLQRYDASNQGIFIDILPTDDVPADMGKRIPLLEKYLDEARRITTYRKAFQKGPFFAFRTRGWRRGLRRYLKICFILLKAGGGIRAYEKVEDMIRKYHFEPGEERVCGLAKWGATSKRYTKVFWPPDELWGELIDMPFEYLTVKAPKAYDHLLTINYGDWHQLVKGGGGHESLEIDPDRPYKEVLIEKYGYTGKEFR